MVIDFYFFNFYCIYFGGTDRHRRIVLTYFLKAEKIAACTKGFSEENFIGKFQFGDVYRGTYRKEDVIVKLWKDDNLFYKVKPGDNLERYQVSIYICVCVFMYIY